MKETEVARMMRREFFASSSFLLLCAGLLKTSALASQAPPTGPDLSEELNETELEIVNKSVMARDMDSFWHKGYS
jgi:hypothetical protein